MNKWHHTTKLTATIDHSVDAAESIRILYARPLDPTISIPPYYAGQYAYIHIPDIEPRPFSIASAPHESSLQFHIRNTGSGISAHIAQHIKQGSTITIELPHGHACYTPQQHNAAITIIAGGSGLSQARSIIAAALHHNPTTPITLFAGNKTRADNYLHGLLTSWQESHPSLNYIPILSEEQHKEFIFGNVGEIAAKEIKNSHIKNMPDIYALNHPLYIAGPPPMVHATARELDIIGINANSIFSDSLPPKKAI